MRSRRACVPVTSPPRRSWRTTSTASSARTELNAFITVDRERALLDARSLARQGRLGALAGVPFAPKDLFDTAGMRTTYGSALFREHVPTRTASAVQRLADAGAVIVGKANLHEFAWGVTSKNPFYGTVGNPDARPRGGRLLGRQRCGARSGTRRIEHRHRHGRLRSASPPSPAARPASSRATDSSRSTAAFRSRPASTTPARWRGRWRSARSRSRCWPTCRVPSRAWPVCGSASSARSPTRTASRTRGPPARRRRCRPGSTRCRSSRPSARIPTASSYGARRDEYSPDLQRKMAPGFELSAVSIGALGRGRRVAPALRRELHSTPRGSDAAVRATARRGGGDPRVPRAGHRLGPAVQLAGLALGDDARRRDVLGAERRDRARGRARLGARPAATDYRDRELTAAGSCPPSR